MTQETEMRDLEQVTKLVEAALGPPDVKDGELKIWESGGARLILYPTTVPQFYNLQEKPLGTGYVRESPWIPISDPPPPGERVCLLAPKGFDVGPVVQGYLVEGQQRWIMVKPWLTSFDWAGDLSVKPTHWMPLPRYDDPELFPPEDDDVQCTLAFDQVTPQPCLAEAEK